MNHFQELPHLKRLCS